MTKEGVIAILEYLQGDNALIQLELRGDGYGLTEGVYGTWTNAELKGIIIKDVLNNLVIKRRASIIASGIFKRGVAEATEQGVSTALLTT